MNNYTEYKKNLPDVGSKVKTDQGEGKVISVDVFKRTYRVNLPDGTVVVVEEKNEGKK